MELDRFWKIVLVKVWVINLEEYVCDVIMVEMMVNNWVGQVVCEVCGILDVIDDDGFDDWMKFQQVVDQVNVLDLLFDVKCWVIEQLCKEKDVEVCFKLLNIVCNF